MAKIDCSTVVGFAHEANRLCEMYDECGKCPFSGRKKCPMAVLDYDDPDVQSIVDALQKWSDEHPVKTRLDDLLEKYPNFKLNPNGYPGVRPFVFGCCSDCEECTRVPSSECWHEPVNGGATGKAVG